MKTNEINFQKYDQVDVFREGVCWVKSNGKWGLIDSNGEMIIKPQYDDVREFIEGFGYFKQSGKWGLVDKAGNIVFEPVFNSILNISEGMALIKIEGKYGFADLINRQIISPVYENAHVFSEGLAAVKLKGKWGFIDNKGCMVIKPEFYLEPPFFTFKEGKIQVVKPGEGDYDLEGYIDREGKVIGNWNERDPDDISSVWTYDADPWNTEGIRTYYGLIDRLGNYKVRPKFQEMHPFKNGMYLVKIDFKWGIIDSEGTYLIEPSYDNIDYVGDDRFRVWVNGKYGFIDSSGQYLMKPRFSKTRLCKFQNGLIEIRDTDGKSGFVDLNGNLVINPQFDYTHNFNNGVAAVCINEKFGIIDKIGNFLVEPIYNEIENGFSCGLAFAKKNGKYGFVDSNGDPVIDFKFDDAWYFQNSLAKVEINDKWGLIDTTGNWRIKPKFEEIDDLSADGKLLYRVNINGKVGIIDESGKFIIDPLYNKIIWNENEKIYCVSYSENNEVKDFIDSLLNDDDEVKWGLIDKNGGWILKAEDSQIKGDRIEYSEGLAAIKIDDKWGYIDTQGRVVIDPDFEQADNFEEGLAIVRKDGKYRVIDRTGNFISKSKFENISSHIKNGYIRVSELLNDNKIKSGVINKEGKYVLAPNYDYLFGDCCEGMVRILEEENFGYADLKTGNIIKPVFNFAYEFNDGLAVVRLTESEIDACIHYKDILQPKTTADI